MATMKLPKPHNGWVILWVAAFFVILAAAPPPQSSTPNPPVPTQTPVPLFPPSAQPFGEWVLAVLYAYGLWFVVSAILLLLGGSLLFAYSKGWLEWITEAGKQDAERIVFRKEMDQAARAYLQQAAVSFSHLKFRGLPRHRAEGIEPPSLDSVYVSLQMTPEGMEEERMAAHKGKRQESAGLQEKMEREPVDLAGATLISRKLALVGPAGCGKSTLLQWAGLACARAALGQKLAPLQESFVSAAGGKEPLFPVLIPLRAFDEYCREKGCVRTPRALLEFIVHYFSQKQSALDYPADLFLERLQNGCLMMFDGLDEVDPDDRQAVRQAVESFLDEHDHPRLACMITSRPSAASVADQLPGFRRCEIQRLTPEQRGQLIADWYRAVLPQDCKRAESRAADLSSRIAGSSQPVQELATTPLMVTIFAMVHYSRDELPRQRARLYEEAVEILLTEAPYKDSQDIPGLQDWDATPWEKRRDLLSCIAFELHCRNVETMLEGDLAGLVWKRFSADEAHARREAARFLRATALRGGLLESQDERYGFLTHRTFREFLAGRYLAEEYPRGQLPAFLYDRLADDLWEEPIRLAAGYLSIRGMSQADEFIRLLAGVGVTQEESAQAHTLAGLALSDFQPERRLPETAQWLSSTLWSILEANPPVTHPPLRRRAGLALGDLGDPRFVPIFSPPLPGEGPGVRLILPPMLPIPAGPFRMGTGPEEEAILKAQHTETWDDEKPAHIATLSAFEIARYPVTNAEFRCFLEADGYNPEAPWWSAEGRLWRTGKWVSDLSIYSEASRMNIQEWLARRPAERCNQPFFWDDPRWNALNLPVVGVCWFEAEAYCNWLSRLTGRRFGLPTEARWEKAARGGAQNAVLRPDVQKTSQDAVLHYNLWPWGDTWDAQRCNNAEAKPGFDQTTPVGIYPDGASPCGALDMAGNVWEWCLDWYAEDEYARPAGGQVIDPRGPESRQARVVRGGSWSYDRRCCRCAYRGRNVPGYFIDDLGFRLALSPR